MNTYLECSPCFLMQALEASKMLGLNQKEKKEILDAAAMKIIKMDLESSPPEMGRTIHRIVKQKTGNPDPYKDIKQRSNNAALQIYPELKNITSNSGDSLLKAVEIAIAGNIIDYGAVFDLDMEQEIQKFLDSGERIFTNEKLFAYAEFAKALKKANTLLYLGDNTGEIVFDRVLIEEIKYKYPDLKIYFATRGAPIINDCLIDDAISCGIDKSAEIISNGYDAPGTILEKCSPEFRKIWNESDLVLSKGQGNFESLTDSTKPIFFLLIVKCQVVANYLNCGLRDIILSKNHNI